MTRRRRMLAWTVVLAAALVPAGIGRGAARDDLSSPARRDVAMRLVSSAENASLDWRGQYAYLEDIGDGRGYTGGIIGFCSGTGDMLAVVARYTGTAPGNPLARYLPALRRVDGSASHAGLGARFAAAWAVAAADPRFRAAQDAERCGTRGPLPGVGRRSPIWTRSSTRASR